MLLVSTCSRGGGQDGHTLLTSDFGIGWWALDRAMVDYDVNEEELENWLE